MTFDELVDKVWAMAPGQRLCVSSETLVCMSPRGDLARALAMSPMGEWTIPDRVLSCIMGSCYDRGCCDDGHGNALFFRLEAPLEDGRRSYVDPDRRHHYRKVGDIYEPIRGRAT